LLFFSKNKQQTDPEIIVKDCLNDLVKKVSEDLSSDGYRWGKPWGVKLFESAVLSKFIIDYSFDGIVAEQLSDDEKKGFFEISNRKFSKYFNDTFSSVGLNYEDMKEDIDNKVEKYFATRREFRKPPQCWHQIYMLVTRSKSIEEIKDDMKNKTSGLELMKTNENFSSMVPQYEMQIKILQDKIGAFELAEMMLPHMIRFTKQRLRPIKLKKIKALSKKLAKKDKKK